jgi:hypothetical protein
MLSAEQAKYTVYAAKVNRKTPRLRGRQQRFYFMRLADAERCKTVLCGLYTYCILSHNSPRVLSYQWFPTSIPCGEAIARRRKEERRAGIASRGMVRRLGRFFSGMRHRVIPERDRMPDRCHASGAAVDVCGDASAWAQQAARAADGGVVDVSRALSMSPRAP